MIEGFYPSKVEQEKINEKNQKVYSLKREQVDADFNWMVVSLFGTIALICLGCVVLFGLFNKDYKLMTSTAIFTVIIIALMSLSYFSKQTISKEIESYKK